MGRPNVCLCLTGKTLAEDKAIVERYRQYIDIAELRLDFLNEDERLKVREFPASVDVPCILTIRRKSDGGNFIEGEASRSMLFAWALAFASQDKSKNFAYVDFEDDFRVSSLQDSALAYGIKVIRSYHNMTGMVDNIPQRLNEMRFTGFEIPKIACMPSSLADVTRLFEQTKGLANTEQIIVAMGPLGLPSRILAAKTNSYLSFTSPLELRQNLLSLGQIDPITLNDIYHFHSIDAQTKIYGITGWPLKVTSSPELQNKFFANDSLNAVFVPFKAEKVVDAFNFAKSTGIRGFSVTIPHKEMIIPHLQKIDETAMAIGACNTVVNRNGVWTGYNTDCTGFSKALLEFSGFKDLNGKKVAIIGAGGAARAVAYALHELGAKCCIFNRTLGKAKIIAQKYGFEYATLSPDSSELIQRYSDIIVQTTSIGMGSVGPSDETNDPLYFYDFSGHEMLYDIIYVPSVTPIMARAALAGCKTHNGSTMLLYQGEAQFELYKEVYQDA